MMAGDDAAFEALTRRISETQGLALHAYKEKCLRRRIAVRMRACGVHTFEDYQAILDQEPQEYQQLKDSLTINVTKFYRNPTTWDRLRQDVLPDLVRAREGRVRVWSAGCASGEEPYTLAMVFAEVAEDLGHPAWADRVAIDATDIDQACLERAAAGRYPESAFGEAPPHYRERYTRDVDGVVEVLPPWRERVAVSRLDLNREPPRRRDYDMIVCRNVVIYFDRPTQERLYHTFADSLAEDGLLVLGKVETLMGPVQQRFTLIDVRERIYRRA